MADFAKEIQKVNIEDEMKQSYLDYAMSVIVGRALPDVRDGLKPVHRRSLFAMRSQRVLWVTSWVNIIPMAILRFTIPLCGWHSHFHCVIR